MVTCNVDKLDSEMMWTTVLTHTVHDLQLFYYVHNLNFILFKVSDVHRAFVAGEQTMLTNILSGCVQYCVRSMYKLQFFKLQLIWDQTNFPFLHKKSWGSKIRPDIFGIYTYLVTCLLSDSSLSIKTLYQLLRFSWFGWFGFPSR